MNVSECKMQWHKPVLPHQVFRHRLFHIWQSLVQGGLHKLVHHLARHTARLELLCAWIHSCHRGSGTGLAVGLGLLEWLLQLLLVVVVCRRRINFRMNDVHPPVKSGRLPEKHELQPRLQLLEHPFDTLEEDKLHFSRAI